MRHALQRGDGVVETIEFGEGQARNPFRDVSSRGSPGPVEKSSAGLSLSGRPESSLKDFEPVIVGPGTRSAGIWGKAGRSGQLPQLKWPQRRKVGGS